MTTATPVRESRPPGTFRHEAFLYSGRDEFVEGTVSFVGEAVADREPVLVALTPTKIEALRAGLGADADAVFFLDMAEVGRNPSRIIPAWKEFVADHAVDGRSVRGIGEPIWPGRTAAELVECQRHEALLNVAFADSPAWRLMCPYDTAALEPAVIDEARRSHPYLVQDRTESDSPDYRGNGSPAVAMDDPLPRPPADRIEIAFSDRLDTVRGLVARQAMTAGLGRSQTADLVTAVNEAATNSLRHGGGRGVLAMWADGARVVCEIRDRGRVDQPLVGRERPSKRQDGGRGLWLVNQLCDLVQLRSSPEGTVVRLHMWCGGRR